MARYPNIGPKHRLKAHFDASEIEVKTRVPRKVIFLYSKHMVKGVVRTLRLVPFRAGNIGEVGAVMMKSYTTRDSKLLVMVMALGSPIVAGTMEILIRSGARQFLILGSAGAISPKLKIGDVVVCTKAVRDEGVSHHYLPPGKYVPADMGLVRKLASFREIWPVTEGPTWTIDAFFAETKKEIRAYSREGVLTVEMEAAAAFAVARKRKVKAAAVFSVSDLLYKKRWSGFGEERKEGYKRLIQLAAFFKDI